MAILAQLEVDDDGALKIKNFRDALSDLGASVVKTKEQIENANRSGATSAKQQADAITQLTAAHRAAFAEQQKYVQGFGILQNQLKAGTTVSQAQAAALQQLGTATQNNTKFSAQYGTQMSALVGQLKTGATVTPQLAQSLQQVASGHNAAATGTTQQTSALQGFNVAAAAAATSLTLIAGGTYALLRSSGDLAARIETMGVVMGIVGKNAHLSSTEMLVQVEAIKKLGITTREANDSVLQFVQSNLKLSDASKIARAAQDLAVIAGENSSQTFQRLTRAIQTGETMLLRQVGIVTTNEAVWREYAKTIGKNLNQLDALDKKQAFVNKILTEAQKATGAYEAAMTTAGKQIGSFARFVEEAELVLGKALLPTMSLVVETLTAFLKAWIALPAPVQAAVTAILSAVAAMALFAGILAGAKLVGLVGVITSVGAAFSAFFATVSAGTPIMAAAMLAFGPWTLALTAIIALLGLGVGAWVAWSSATKVSTQELQTAAASAIETKEAFDKIADAAVAAEEKFSEYRTKGITPTIDEQLKYRDLAEKLLAISPQMVQVIDAETRTYRILTSEIKNATAAREEDVQASLKAMKTNTATLRAEADRLQTELRKSQDELGKMQRGEVPSFVTGLEGESIDVMGIVKRKVDDLKQALKEVSANAKTAETAMLDAMGRALPATERQRNAMNEANEILVEYSSKLGGAGKNAETLTQRMKILNLTNAALLKAMEKGPEGIQGFLSSLDMEWDKIVKKREKDAKKMQSAVDALAKSVLDNDPIDMAKFKKAAELLSETGMSTEEYARRVQKLKPILDAFSKSTDPAVKGITALQKAVNSLDTKAYEDALEKGMLANQKLAESMGDKLTEAARNSTKELEALQLESNRKLDDMRLAQADREREVNEQIFESTKVSKMREVDQALYAEKKKLDGILRGYDREKLLRDRALQQERDAVNKRAQLALEETQIFIDKINREAELQLQLQRNRVGNMQPGAARDQAAAELRAAEVIRDLDRKTLSEYQSNQARQIEAHRQAQQAILDQQQKANSAIDASNDKLAKDQTDASAKVKTQIIKDHDSIRASIINLGKQVALQFMDGFIEMAKGAKSFKDVMVGIFQSIRDALFNVVKQMVANWIEGFGKMKDAQQGSGTSGKFGGGTGKLGAIAGAAGFGMIAGGIAGQYADGSYTKGALGGAAAGAGAGAAYGSVVPGIGTAVGAGIGALAGGITGFFAARGQRKQMKEDRDQLIKDMGGLEEFQRKAEEAGFEYSKLLNTKSPKEFGSEVKKLQESLDKLDLKKARADMIETAGGMDALRKSMTLVGFNSEKLFKTENVSEYNKEVERLNELLDAQKKRMEGLSTAATGFAAMVSGFAMTVQKEIESGKKGGVDEKDVIKNFQSDWQARFNTMGMVASAVFGRVLRETGDIVQAMNAIAEPMDKLIELQDKLGLAADGSFGKLMQLRRTIKDNEDIATSLSGITQVLSGLAQAGGLTAELFNAMGADATQLFTMLTERGADADSALLVMQPTLQALYEAQKKFGFATDESTQKLIDMGIEHGIVGDEFQSVSQQMLDVLLLIADVLGADIPDAYRKQADAAEAAGGRQRGVLDETGQAAERARQKLESMGGVAYNAGKEIRDQFGNVISVVDGVGDAWGRVAGRAREAEDAMRDAGQAGVEAGQATEDSATGAAEGSSPTGIKQIIIRAKEAMEVFRAFKDSMVNDSTNMESAATGVSDKIDLLKRMAEAGINPESLSKIYQAAQEQNGGVDPSVTDTVNAPAAAAAATSAATQPVTITMEVKPEISINALDGADVERVVREQVGPEMLSMLRSNTDQMTVQIEEALSRYRRGE